MDLSRDHEATLRRAPGSDATPAFASPRRSAQVGTFATLVAYATAMPLLASGAGVWWLPEIAALFERASTWALPLFAMTAAATTALALTPTIAVAALAGGLFGLTGVAPAVLAYALASVAVFEVVRRFLQADIQAAVARSRRGRAAQAEFEQATFRIVVLSRLSPVLPFALVSVLLAVSPVGRWTYLAGTLAGMLPRTLGAVAVGAATGRVLTEAGRGGELGASGTPLGLVVPVLAALGTAGLLWYAARAIRRALSASRAPSR